MSRSSKGKNSMMKMAINQNIMGQVFTVGQGPEALGGELNSKGIGHSMSYTSRP